MVVPLRKGSGHGGDPVHRRLLPLPKTATIPSVRRMAVPFRRGALEGAGIVLLLLAVAVRLAHHLGNAWDFEVFYHAARAARHGLDPYRLADLVAISGKPIDLEFFYPPLTLVIFAPLSRLPLEVAGRVWLTLQLLLTLALLVLWRRKFVPGTSSLLFVMVAFLGFDAALFTDLRVGNVTVLEQWLLWTAFACYLDDRRGALAALVVASALFKLLPIAFLGLLLAPSQRRESTPRLAASALAVLLAAVVLPVLWGPAWARGFLANLPAERPTGALNPCALGLIDTLLGPWAFTPAGTRVAVALWALYGIALLMVSREALRATWRARDPMRWVVVGSFLFALLAPRMMIYSYVLLIAPMLLAVPVAFPRARDQVVVWLLVTFQGALQFLPGTIDWGVFGYVPFLATLGTWLAYQRRLANDLDPGAESDPLVATAGGH